MIEIPKFGGITPETGTTPETNPELLKNIVFTKRTKQDGSPEYVNSVPGRKILILGSSSAEPKENIAYDVLIIKDTKPRNPLKGKLIGEIIADAPLKFENEDAYAPIEKSADGKKVYVLDLELDVPECPPGLEKYVPPLEEFRYFTLDERTLEILYKVAEAYRLKQPCLLEGEPATSKTEAVRFLSAILNQPIRRMGYNGQTDTSELIGKYVPNDGDLKIAFEKLLANNDLLSGDSKAILEKVQNEGRGLNQIESQKIAQNEGLKVFEWVWEDGHLLFSAKNGCILLHDELGFAEPQILGRGLSSLEKNPSIEVSENGGVVIRNLSEEEMVLYKNGKLEGIEPIHPNFRQYGATNPAETHGGRFSFEPAYRDRWPAQKFVKPPSEEEYGQMLKLMIDGEQPLVAISGKKYQAPSVPPLFKVLSEVPLVKELISKLAKFQVKIEELARNREIGKSRKEKYIFTRRGLIEFLYYLESKTFIDRETGEKTTIREDPKEIVSRGLQFYYLDKIADKDDLKKVKDIVEAIGIP